MRVKYLGPSGQVFVEPYGPHRKDEIKDYPDDFAKELLATSKKQHFEKASGSGLKGPEVEIQPEGEDKLIEAARQAIAAGKVTRERKPLVEAMAEILGREVTGPERDRAWEQLNK